MYADNFIGCLSLLMSRVRSRDHGRILNFSQLRRASSVATAEKSRARRTEMTYGRTQFLYKELSNFISNNKTNKHYVCIWRVLRVALSLRKLLHTTIAISLLSFAETLLSFPTSGSSALLIATSFYFNCISYFCCVLIRFYLNSTI